MLEVQIENIIPVSEAHDKFDQLIDSVTNSDDLYVLTKDGKPSAVVVGAHHLETLTGDKHTELMGAATGTTSGIETSPTPQTNPGTTSPTDNAGPTSADSSSFSYDNIVKEKAEDSSTPTQTTPTPVETPTGAIVTPADNTANMSDGINDTIAMSAEPAPSGIGATTDPNASLSIDDQADEPDPSNTADISADSTNTAPTPVPEATIEPVLSKDPMATATAAPADAITDPNASATPPASPQV